MNQAGVEFWRRSRSLMLALACLLALNVPATSAAQNTLNIAAVVNDEIISVYDLSQRISMIVAFSNLPNTQQTHQRIAGDVLRRLISERIRLQEAARLEIQLEDSVVENAIAQLEVRNNMPKGGVDNFLGSRGIDRETLVQQLRSEHLWVRVVSTLFRNSVTISENEVDDIVKQMQEDTGKPEYLLAEVFLAYDGKPRAEVMDLAGRIRNDLAAGANWGEIAQNFSQAPSASRGGDIGWNMARELHPAVANVISRMQPNSITEPIETEDGVYVVALRGKRTSRGISVETEPPKVSLQQLHLPIPTGASPTQIAEVTARIQSIASGAQNCDQFAELGRTQGSAQSGFLGEFEINKLNPSFQNLVVDVEANQTTQPLQTNDGVIVLMVCSRTEEKQTDAVEEARAQIRARLLNERLTQLADQHETKLRRQAFIDIRL